MNIRFVAVLGFVLVTIEFVLVKIGFVLVTIGFVAVLGFVCDN